MNMESMNILFGVVGAGCGVYCLYAYYMLVTKQEINQSILLSKDVDIYKCKDKDEYIRKVRMPLLLFGIAALIYGGIELFNALVQPVGTVLYVISGLFFLVLVWFAVVTAKLRKKHFPG